MNGEIVKGNIIVINSAVPEARFLSNDAFCPNMVLSGSKKFVSVTHAMEASKFASEKAQQMFASYPLNTLKDGSIATLKATVEKKNMSAKEKKSTLLKFQERAEAWKNSGMIGVVAKEASKNFFDIFPSLMGSYMYNRSIEEEGELLLSLLRSKFERDHEFKRVLLGTKEAYLLQFSWSHLARKGDKFLPWSGYAEKNKDGTSTVYGSNLVGKALMTIREELRKRGER